MARKTKEEAMETRDRILSAAIDIFYEQGVGKSSLEDIAEAAGVTRGAVYWHFKNKIDIFSALHDQFHTSVTQLLVERHKEGIAHPLQELQDFSIAFLIELNHNERERKILSLFSLKCDYSGEMASFISEQKDKKKESMDLICSFFFDAKKAGQISFEEDPVLLGLSFFCYICGICNEFLRHPELFDLDTQAKPLIAQFFNKFK